MADIPIYENPNGRRRRKGYSTEVRNKVLGAKEYYNINSPDFEFNTIEHMFYRTGAHNVKSPWANTTNAKFKSYVGEGRTVQNYSYNKEELQSFIEETAKIIQQDYGLENIDVRTVYGTIGGIDESTNGMFSWNNENPNINHIDIYADTIWRDYGDPNGRRANRFVKGGGIENVKEKIKETLAHEMRHQWQHTTDTGKAIEEADNIYKQTKINDYTDDFDKYYHEPVEVDARYHGEKFRKTYELKLKKYKEKLAQQGFNEEFRNKMEEINLRPKNRIIGHQFEKEPININSYRRFDNVEPIDWNIDTGNKSPIDKHDVSRNTRYKNAKLSKGQKKLRPKTTMDGNNIEPVDWDIDTGNKTPVGKHDVSKNARHKNAKLKKGQKKLRPKITMDGNNIDIDSIYNHAVPKKIPLTKKGIAKAIIGNAVENIAQETVEEIAKNTKKVVGNMDDPTTWTDEFIEQMAEDDPYYFDELQRRRQEAIDNKGKGQSQVDPNDPTTWTDDYMDEISEGDPDYYEQLRKQRQEAIDGNTKIPETKPNNTANNINNINNINNKPNYTNYGPRIVPASSAPNVNKMPISNRTNINTGPIASPVIQNYNPNIKTNLAPPEPPSKLGKLSKMDIAMTGLNIVGAIGDYKDARRKGHGVVSSAARAGVKFAVDEALGWWALPIGLAKTVPGAIIKGADILHKENRRMNSAANFQTFGDAQFMDTQQLATMRQSGMEMAKMAQYNLQQTLMGNEATYLHR
jgi:hypothetical protein